ncbi:MAG: YkgJ family cysteine cluster protein [Deltaproteobacteria bacterium]|jgi:Fe-S-cluster containining protein|nr:YkgJ family cysteine cluster protein [Deltaproteobacteria bacterium]
MALDLKEHFVKYEALVHMVDSVFERVKKEYPKEVFCRKKCSDCCYAIFDLTLIEALYLNDKFLKKFSGMEKNSLIEIADKTDRVLVKMKRNAYREVKNGAEQLEIVAKMSQERVRCPLLGKDDLCVMYEHRPITCRVYGIPTSTEGSSHICGRTNFKQGEPYPTLNMDKLYSQLQLFSVQLIKDINSEQIKMHEMLIPVSMAMITQFNEEYLGVKK